MSDFSASPLPPSAPRASGSPLTADDLAAFNDEIAAMARAGLPLDQGLTHLAREMGRGGLQSVTATLAEDLKAGKTLLEALARQGNRLPPFYVSLVAAGIRTGRLSDALATLTAYARSMNELRTTVINSLVYPAIILLLGSGLILFWLFYIGPQFREMYEMFRLRLPTATQWLMVLVDHRVYGVVVPLAVLCGAAVATKLIFSATEPGRIRWGKLTYAIPLIGTLLRSARLAGFTDLLAILVEYRVPLPEAYRLAAASSSDPLLRASALEIVKQIAAGRTLGAALRDQRLVPDFLVWMIGMGERSQRLPETLHNTATFYRKQTESRASLLRHVLPAVAIVIVALLMLAFTMAAFLMPMTGMLEGLSGGPQ